MAGMRRLCRKAPVVLLRFIQDKQNIAIRHSCLEAEMIPRRVLVASLILLPALAAPAGAQFVPRHTYPPVATADPFLPDSRLPGPGVWGNVGFLHDRIDRARDAGLLSRREARRLSRQANRIADRAFTYSRDGLSSSEQVELQSRTRAVESAISQAAVTRD
jgi:hypothetical protein